MIPSWIKPGARIKSKRYGTIKVISRMDDEKVYYTKETGYYDYLDTLALSYELVLKSKCQMCLRHQNK